MKISREFTRRPRIEMIPLIDVVFLLLVFFIYSMFSMTVHRGLPVNLPIASTSPIDKKAYITITLQQDGKLFLENPPLPVEGGAGRESRCPGLSACG